MREIPDTHPLLVETRRVHVVHLAESCDHNAKCCLYVQGVEAWRPGLSLAGRVGVSAWPLSKLQTPKKEADFSRDHVVCAV